MIAILGMCKNAGKTTVLNRLINEYRSSGRSLAVTSVGRDGEGVDLVTGTAKPPIYIHEGMLAATASGLFPFSDVSRELLDVTDTATPLGNVTVFKARSGGFVQLAGPSSISDMSRLCLRLRELGAETVLIDGALDRLSPAAAALDGVCILSTGASLDTDMGAVVAETAFICRVLTLPECGVVLIRNAECGIAQMRNAECGMRNYSNAELLKCGKRYGAFSGERFEWADSVEGLCLVLRHFNADGILFSGALTDTAARAIARSGAKLEGMKLIVEDSSRMLVKSDMFERLISCGAEFLVRRATTLAAVTVNPVSAGGWRFDAERFLEEMQNAVAVPVVDVGDAEFGMGLMQNA